MSVNLNRFVNVTIDYQNLNSTSTGTRDTIVLLDTTTPLNKIKSSAKPSILEGAVVSSVSEFMALCESTIESEDVLKYVNCFFDNNGKKIKYFNKNVYNEAQSSSLDDQTWILLVLSSIPSDLIVICSTVAEATFRNISGLLINDSDFQGIHEKILISSKTASAIGDVITSIADRHNYIIKYGAKGVEMTVAAYLSNIKITSSTKIEDYAFTPEAVSSVGTGGTISDDAIIGKIIEQSGNVDTYLAGDIRNIGGNTISGKDLVNHFVKILLTQTVTEKLVNTLTTKIRYDQTGLTTVSSALIDELNRYLNYGYLMQNKVWTDNDLYVTVNGVQYLIISKNDLLSLGYKFVILPFSSLTAQEKTQHMLPRIYLIIADSYSIRVINITGKVF